MTTHLICQLKARLEEAEQEIERQRGSFRGIVWKLRKGSLQTALSIAEHALKNSRRIYPHPIKGEPEDPEEPK